MFLDRKNLLKPWGNKKKRLMLDCFHILSFEAVTLSENTATGIVLASCRCVEQVNVAVKSLNFEDVGL